MPGPAGLEPVRRKATAPLMKEQRALGRSKLIVEVPCCCLSRWIAHRPGRGV